MDPLAEKYYDGSPYNYVGNNPISRIDPDGMKWADAESKKEAKAAKAVLRESIKAVRTYKPADSKERIAELKKGIKEIRMMGRDKDFTFKLAQNHSSINETSIDPSNNSFISMTYDLGNGFIKDDGIRAHEMKHGYQAMTQELNYHPITGKVTYDQTDELAASQRQYSVLGQLQLNTGPNSTTRITNYNGVTLNQISNIYDLQDKKYLYRNLPKSSLRTDDVILQKAGGYMRLNYSNFTFEDL